MSKITIADLEVLLRVGVTDEERAKPQRVLLTLELECDISAATRTDQITETIDYFDVAQQLLQFGEGRSWKLIEKLAADIADLVLSVFNPESVKVEVKKFPFPQARYVAVSLTRKRAGAGIVKRAASGIP